jgi:hypothetical protein
MIRPRWTIRFLMIGLLLVALALGLARPAVEVWRDREIHGHVFVMPNPNGAGLGVDLNVASPFWPRYWRRVCGRLWKKIPLCDLEHAREAEVCNLATPGILWEAVPGSFSPRINQTLREALDRHGADPVNQRSARAALGLTSSN